MGPFQPMSEIEFVGGLVLVALIGVTVWLFRRGREHARGDRAAEAERDLEQYVPSSEPRLQLCAKCGEKHSAILPCATIIKEE